MATKDKFNVDQILEKLLSVRGAQPGKMVELTEAQITGCEYAHSNFDQWSHCEFYMTTHLP